MAQIAATVSFTGTGTLVANARLNPLLVSFKFGQKQAAVSMSVPVKTKAFTPINFRAERYRMALERQHFLWVRLPPRPVFPKGVTTSLYRLFVVDEWGVRFAELQNAKLDIAVLPLNEYEAFSFSLDDSDPKIVECQVATREVQLWRGNRLIGWYVIVRAARDANGVVTFSTLDPSWYFSKRFMGKAPMPNYLKNGSFEQGFHYWKASFQRGSSSPTTPSVRSVSTPTISAGRAMQVSSNTVRQTVRLIKTTYPMTSILGFGSKTTSGKWRFNSTTLTNGGKTHITRLIAAAVRNSPTAHYYIKVHHHRTGNAAADLAITQQQAQAIAAYIRSKIPAAAKITAIGVGSKFPYVHPKDAAPLSVPLSQARNRIEMYATVQSAKDHQQFIWQNNYFNNPVERKEDQLVTLTGWAYIKSYAGASKDGILAVLYAAVSGTNTKRIVQKKSVVTVSKNTPLNKWIRIECSVAIPPNGVTYAVVARLYPTIGTVVWDEVAITADNANHYYSKDQAHIFNDLVKMAQSPVWGKTDLNISPIGPATKVKRTRTYKWIERDNMRDAIYEFPTLANGFDIAMVYTSNQRYIKACYPRRGSDKGYVFELGANVANYSLAYDGEIVANRVIVQAAGEGNDREEGVYANTSLLGGQVFEKVYEATPGSAVSSLDAQAKRGVSRYGKPPAICSVVMYPTHTDELLSAVEVGDIVTVQVPGFWKPLSDKYRVTSRSIDVATDSISYEISPYDGLG